MSIRRRVGAFVVAWAPLFAGCVAGQPIDGLDEPSVAPMDKNGSTGTNGLDSEERTDEEAALIDATQTTLVAPGTMKVSWQIQDELLSTDAGVRVFEYAIRCALPAGVTVTWPGGQAEGMGHLHDTANWLDGPLSEEAQFQLLACVIAHVNPYGKKVPLLLSGPGVLDDGGNHSEYTVDEALWVARRNSDGVLVYVVWPLKPLKAACGPDPYDALQDRVCGQDPEGCHLQMGDPQDCVSEWDGFYCLGQPALMTTLKTPGLEDLYPGCSP